jgi:hypothetical protein
MVYNRGQQRRFALTDEPKKLQSVQITTPMSVSERTNDLRINKDTAQRLIARYLRDAKFLPDAANQLSNRICEGLLSNMPTPSRPALRGHRMIDSYPPHDRRSQVAAAFRRLRRDGEDWEIARDGWAVVYEHGQAMPDDIVV